MTSHQGKIGTFPLLNGASLILTYLYCLWGLILQPFEGRHYFCITACCLQVIRRCSYECHLTVSTWRTGHSAHLRFLHLSIISQWRSLLFETAVQASDISKRLCMNIAPLQEVKALSFYWIDFFVWQMTLQEATAHTNKIRLHWIELKQTLERVIYWWDAAFKTAASFHCYAALYRTVRQGFLVDRVGHVKAKSTPDVVAHFLCGGVCGGGVGVGGKVGRLEWGCPPRSMDNGCWEL